MTVDAWSVLRALWLFLPAYVANMSPVFSAKLFPKWKRPIDGGRIAKDGNRMLGDGKTWRGLIGGGVAAGGTAVALAYGASGVFSGDDFGLAQGSHPAAIAAFGFIVGIMALVGDVTESYVKRRTGRQRGAPWIPFDQLDFVVFGLVGFAIGAPLLAEGWVLETVFKDWIVLTTLLVGTVALHLLVNRIGYWLGLKEVPW